MSSKIFNSIQKQINSVSLPVLMDASNIFGHGMGENRIKLVLEKHPDILTTNERPRKKEMVSEIDVLLRKQQ